MQNKTKTILITHHWTSECWNHKINRKQWLWLQQRPQQATTISHRGENGSPSCWASSKVCRLRHEVHHFLGKGQGKEIWLNWDGMRMSKSHQHGKNKNITLLVCLTPIYLPLWRLELTSSSSSMMAHVWSVRSSRLGRGDDSQSELLAVLDFLLPSLLWPDGFMRLRVYKGSDFESWDLLQSFEAQAMNVHEMWEYGTNHVYKNR